MTPFEAVILGIQGLIVIIIFQQSSSLKSHVESRFESLSTRITALQQVMESRFDSVNSKFETAHEALLRVEGVMDARLKHLEGDDQ